jgi:glycosyltransferase involved in cell wall biosynthesis
MRRIYRLVRRPPIAQWSARCLGSLKAHTPSSITGFIDRHRPLISKFMPERAREYLRVTMDLAENLRTPLKDRLEEFLDTEAMNNPLGRLFVFFSGTTFTESEGQRPTRLARELARRGIPVLFCYWRWKTSEPPQVAKFPHVFCLPIDEFLKNYESLLSDSRLEGLKRTFLMEFPHPALMEVVNYANAFGWKTVYDVIDDWEEFEKCGQAVWYDRDFESYLMRNADIATITCRTLLDKLADGKSSRCYMLPNAYEDWANPQEQNIAKTEKVPGKITIGYFGHLTSSWFDWPLIVETAKKHPQWNFQIIGYGMDQKFEPLPNVVHLGKVEHSQLPSHAQSWDVAMIPFKPSRLSAAVDPIKIYEYIALGLPTVVTGMPHLASYPGVFTAETAKEFEQALEAAAAHPLKEAEVTEFLDRNRWANRVDQLLKLLDQCENQSAASRALAIDDLLPFEKAA